MDFRKSRIGGLTATDITRKRQQSQVAGEVPVALDDWQNLLPRLAQNWIGPAPAEKIGQRKPELRLCLCPNQVESQFFAESLPTVLRGF